MPASAFRRSLLPCAAAFFFGFCVGPGGGELGANGAPRQDAVQDASILGQVSVSITLFVSGLANPLDIARAGDGSGRLFVTEQAGRIRIVRNGVLEARPFLDIASRVLSGGERGLLCAAFPPGFATKRYFYVNYTRNPDGATVVSRIRLTADPDLADASQEEVILIVPQPFANHNGGQMAFGPRDGYLYIALGDGGSAGDPFGNGQNPAALLGKILRIDTESGVPPYAVPPTNPFVSQSGTRPEIWALGLRNPWRFSFDRETHDLFIADVGQNQWEEVDFQPAASPGGENYGWDFYEGNHPYQLPTGGGPPANYSPPVAEYDHTQGCSVTGGVVYRGALYGALYGVYFYGDYCSGRIWGLTRNRAMWQSAVLADTAFNISTFGEDDAGNVYFADYAGGAIYAITGERVKRGSIKK